MYFHMPFRVFCATVCVILLDGDPSSRASSLSFVFLFPAVHPFLPPGRFWWSQWARPFDFQLKSSYLGKRHIEAYFPILFSHGLTHWSVTPCR